MEVEVDVKLGAEIETEMEKNKGMEEEVVMEMMDIEKWEILNY